MTSPDRAYYLQSSPMCLEAIAHLPGISTTTANKCAARGLHKVWDLWLFLPLRYEDRTQLHSIRQLRHGQQAHLEGQIIQVTQRLGRKPVLDVVLADDGGDQITLRFFHARSFQAKQLVPHARIRVIGQVHHYRTNWSMIHPRYQCLAAADTAALPSHGDPIYPAIDGLREAALRQLMAIALTRLQHVVRRQPVDCLSARWRQRLQLPPLADALLTIHQPNSATIAALTSRRHPALRRLAFEELLAHHLSMRAQRCQQRQARTQAMTIDPTLVTEFLATLPFTLTGAQQRVFAEIANDLAQPVPMLRLVQGDVGCGKTMIAVLAAMVCVRHGCQVALAAPTALLAEQHVQHFRQWLQPFGIQIAWLSGRVTGRARREVLAKIASGAAQVVIGTHALMQKGVHFFRLALVIIDEQHRFGVRQRLALHDKGAQSGDIPHQLVMTATPIPRTLAMVSFADLDVSVIDELPPNRCPVQTVVISDQRRTELIARIAQAYTQGQQVYWVCPMIEESEEPGHHGSLQALQTAQATFALLTRELPDCVIGLVHGRMPSAQKHQVMQAFQGGDIALLVATTVIEVGVDVPNATLMVIENAERLGLAQLHQLRGRVGRGSQQSCCVLLYHGPLSNIARQRLELMRQTDNGFVIAEQDLQLRGPGEMFGARQTGSVAWRVADLTEHSDLLPQVASCADELMRDTPAQAQILADCWLGSAQRLASA